MNNKRVIITGAAGFIGANLVMELLHNIESVRIIGIDSMRTVNFTIYRQRG